MVFCFRLSGFRYQMRENGYEEESSASIAYYVIT